MPRILVIKQLKLITVAPAVTFVLLCAILLMACASHGRRLYHFMAGSRCHTEPVISNHQIQPGVDDESCIWQRSILMGEKCQLPDFSGMIAYDAAGNRIVPGRCHPKHSLK